MFNYLQIVNMSNSSLNLRVVDSDNSTKEFVFKPFQKRSDIPERFKKQLVDNYSRLNVLVQEQPISYLGELPTAPTRVFPGFAGNFGYKNGVSYYCVADKVWVASKPFPNEDTWPTPEELAAVTNPPTDNGSGSGLTVIHIPNYPAVEQGDGERKSFSVPFAVYDDNFKVFINGLPYHASRSGSTFLLGEEVFAPDELDEVTISANVLVGGEPV